MRNLAPVFTDEDDDTEGIQVDPREVAEDAAADATVGAPVVATDNADADDTGDDNEIIYRLSGADAASFTIDPSRWSDNMVGANAMLDYEATKNTYMVTVTATDQEGLRLLRRRDHQGHRRGRASGDHQGPRRKRCPRVRFRYDQQNGGGEHGCRRRHRHPVRGRPTLTATL